MRFRYFDEAGTEVEVSTVEALAFRIRTGAVQPDTLLFDAAVDEWGPAGDHPVYNFVTEEDAAEELAAAAPEAEGGDEEASDRSPGGGASPEPPPSSGSPPSPAPSSPPESPTPSPESPTIRRAPPKDPSGYRRALAAGGIGVVVLAAALAVLAVGDAGAPAGEWMQGGVAEAADAEAPALERRSEAEGAVPGQTTSDEERLATLTADVIAASTGDLAVSLLDLQAALDVPEEPPEAWLQGIYLADAASYPGVRRYWESFGNSVSVMRALEDELFRGFVKDHVGRMGLGTDEADLLSARVLARFAGASRKREVVYDDLEELATEAVELHRLLVRRTDAISYEPFSEKVLSRDPVVEAVPDDPELAREVWAQVDRIFEILERVHGIGPVTTRALQEAVLQGIRLPDPATAP